MDSKLPDLTPPPASPQFDWNVVLIKLSSRKLWVFVIALLTSLVGLLQHQVDFTGFLVAVIAAATVYMGSEGIADSGSRS